MSSRKELREQYKNRHPDMGVVTWRCGGNIWVMATKDAKATFNGMNFQLKLGSWPGRELQEAYRANPEGFVWMLEKPLEYEDAQEDHSEELELLLMEFMEEHPDARPMKPGIRTSWS